MSEKDLGLIDLIMGKTVRSQHFSGQNKCFVDKTKQKLPKY